MLNMDSYFEGREKVIKKEIEIAHKGYAHFTTMLRINMAATAKDCGIVT